MIFIFVDFIWWIRFGDELIVLPGKFMMLLLEPLVLKQNLEIIIEEEKPSIHQYHAVAEVICP